MLYLIKGEEPLLIQEAIDNIKEKGYTHKKIYDAPNQKSLEDILLDIKSPSLFDDENDKYIYIIKTTKDLKNLPEAIKKITIFPINLKQFPIWLETKFQKAGFKISPKSKQLLCEHFEGNILAADQCLQKIKLLYTPGNISDEQILDVLMPSARYTVFDLINNLNSTKIPVILERLKEEAVEPAIILWALARECRKRKVEDTLPALIEVDEIIKGISKGNCWEALLRASFQLAGRSLL